MTHRCQGATQWGTKKCTTGLGMVACAGVQALAAHCRCSAANENRLKAKHQRSRSDNLRVQLDRFDDVVQFVGDGDCFVGVRSFGDASAAECFMKDVLVGGVISNRRRGVFQFVTG